MVFGTLYDVVAIQMNRPSQDKEEVKPEPAVFRKTGVQNGGFLPEPEISKVALPDEEKTMSNGGATVTGSEVAVEDVKVIVSPARPTAEVRSMGIYHQLLHSFYRSQPMSVL